MTESKQWRHQQQKQLRSDVFVHIPYYVINITHSSFCAVLLVLLVAVLLTNISVVHVGDSKAVEVAVGKWLLLQTCDWTCWFVHTQQGGKTVRHSQKIQRSSEHNGRCLKRTRFAQISNTVWNPEPQSNHGWWCHNHKLLSNHSQIAFELSCVNDA